MEILLIYITQNTYQNINYKNANIIKELLNFTKSNKEKKL